MKKLLPIILLFTLLGCTTTPSNIPSNYKGDAGMTTRLYNELSGSYFNDEPDSPMTVTVHSSQVYAFEYAPQVINDTIHYDFQVWIANPQTDYLQAVADIMAVLQTIPEEDRGELDPGLFYDRSHAR